MLTSRKSEEPPKIKQLIPAILKHVRKSGFNVGIVSLLEIFVFKKVQNFDYHNPPTTYYAPLATQRWAAVLLLQMKSFRPPYHKINKYFNTTAFTKLYCWGLLSTNVNIKDLNCPAK
jgi:hypothetical protein